MASKMKHRQEDKRTKAKDRWLVATGVSGLVVLIVHDTILSRCPPSTRTSASSSARR